MTQRDRQADLLETAILASLVAIACTIIAWQQPLAAPSPSMTTPLGEANQLGWMLLQSTILVAFVVGCMWLASKAVPRSSRRLGRIALVLLPVVMIGDAITFRWIGERFLSLATLRVLNHVGANLSSYVTGQMILDGITLLALICVWTYLMVTTARWLAARWRRSKDPPNLSAAISTGLLGVVVIGSLPLRDPRSTLERMAADSARHPLCVFRLIPYRGVEANAPEPPSIITKDRFHASTARREQKQRHVDLDPASQQESYRDVLIVVVESFRRELVTSETMPHLWKLAHQGIHCRNHFSGGNATNHGMFSLVNGLEATWFQRPVTYNPIMNRLFHAAGYELGFFAGHDDWRRFLMDGFIDPRHFDVFECTAPNGLLSDRQATERAIQFLARPHGQSVTPTRPPRLALLYLYATHATYQSYADDQVFQPAMGNRMRYPYAADVRDQVWNRYKNSARTVDRLLAAAIRDDLVLLVTGDHGESFLEDGTIGHGIRISEFQNMTPAILVAPDLAPRSIEAPTSHIDLLPTLLDLVAIRVTHPTVFEGTSLCQTPDAKLLDRVFVTRNYLDNDYALIGPGGLSSSRPFGFRATISFNAGELTPLNAIDHEGYSIPSGSSKSAAAKLRQWRDQRSLDGTEL